ncbi:MAG: 3-phosphoshikimate 1-carboxyvinyltransferase, partial [Clostridiales bacterium]|nr:3-phosphoshikimate 1-carboxyvinyltransferase [Clostridiales bacterium]
MKKNTAMKIQAPPDKSITHRAIILCAIAKGRCTVFNPLFCLDTLATLDCMTRLGANIETRDNKLVFAGEIKFCKNVVLNAMNSGTTMRLLTGLTSSIEDMRCTIYGDKSLNSRPQMRTVQPLNQRGAKINIHGNFAPLNISGS